MLPAILAFFDRSFSSITCLCACDVVASVCAAFGIRTLSSCFVAVFYSGEMYSAEARRSVCTSVLGGH